MELGEHAVFATHVVRALDRGSEGGAAQHVLATGDPHEIGEIGVPRGELFDAELGVGGDLGDVLAEMRRDALEIEALTGANRAGLIEEALQRGHGFGRKVSGASPVFSRAGPRDKGRRLPLPPGTLACEATRVSRPPSIAFALGALAAACHRSPDYGLPMADRSDGTVPHVVAAHVEPGAIHVDGKLDEPAWQRAGSTGLFVAPGSGRPAPESKVNAHARVAWDAERLFVGAVVFDAAPSTPFSREDVDPHVWAQASGIELMLQPGSFSDNRDYFELQVDVGGAVWDTRFDDYNRPVTGGPDDANKRFGHQEWQSHVERAVGRERDRYVVELALPWAALATSRVPQPPRAGDHWRANFYSFREGQGDSLAWSPLLGQGNFHRTSRFGTLELAP